MQKTRNLTLLLITYLISSLTLMQACSVVQATSGPSSKDLSVLKKGTDRYSLLAELGQPIASEKNENGNRVDVFSFVQGQHGAAKAGKGLVYGVLAVGTLGLSELVTSPLEGAAGDGAEIQLKVTYDENDKVSTVDVLKDKRWVPVQRIKDQQKS